MVFATWGTHAASVARKQGPTRTESPMLLKRLKRWLGWDSDSGSWDFGNLDPRPRPNPAPPKPIVPTVTPRPAEKANPAPAQRRAKERSPMDVLDNPRLSLDKPADDGFDPYNTGAFNRSTSWEKIGRQRKR
jgi:hypothetical protein